MIWSRSIPCGTSCANSRRPNTRPITAARCKTPLNVSSRRSTGACLPVDKRLHYGQVMQRLAELTTRFGQNVLADESATAWCCASEADLAGLPDFVRAAARQAASERGDRRRDVITLSRSHIVPFLTFSERRDLREQAWRAWTDARRARRASTTTAPVAREILALRLEQARAARLRHLRRLRARRHDGRRRRGGDRAADAGLGAGDGARRRGARRARRRWRRSRGDDRRASRPGTGATTPRRCASVRYDARRGRGQAVLPARRAWSRRRSIARGACSACASSRGRTIDGLPPRRAGLRGARRRATAADRRVPARQLRPRRPSAAAPG